MHSFCRPAQRLSGRRGCRRSEIRDPAWERVQSHVREGCFCWVFLMGYSVKGRSLIGFFGYTTNKQLETSNGIRPSSFIPTWRRKDCPPHRSSITSTILTTAQNHTTSIVSHAPKPPNQPCSSYSPSSSPSSSLPSPPSPPPNQPSTPQPSTTTPPPRHPPPSPQSPTTPNTRTSRPSSPSPPLPHHTSTPRT